MSFDDSAWAEARAGLGYGDGDDVTVLPDMKGRYLAFYARRGFRVDDPSSLRALILRINYEDGFVAYLNGAEVARRGLGAPGSPVQHDTAASHREAGAMESLDLSPEIPHLVPGDNVLAVEVHSHAASDANVTFRTRN